MAQLKYFGMAVTNQDLIQEEIKRRQFGYVRLATLHSEPFNIKIRT
jgi:chorismate synthase